MRILVLDDDHERLRIFRRNLIGHIVTCVETAQGAIENLGKEQWDWVFLDHDLGGKQMVASSKGTGYEVAQWLHDHPERKPEKIVIHSFNPIGAENMKSLLPEAVYKPGVWLEIRP